MTEKLKYRLNNTIIKNIKPSGRDQKFYDGYGLLLFMNKEGAKYWHFRYRFDGKEKRISMGVYPEVSLAQAREAVMDAREILRGGEDPSEVRKAKKQNQSFNTFLIDEQEAIMQHRQIEFYQELSKFLKRWVEKFDYDTRLIDMISEVLKK